MKRNSKLSCPGHGEEDSPGECTGKSASCLPPASAEISSPTASVASSVELTNKAGWPSGSVRNAPVAREGVGTLTGIQ